MYATGRSNYVIKSIRSGSKSKPKLRQLRETNIARTTSKANSLSTMSRNSSVSSTPRQRSPSVSFSQESHSPQAANELSDTAPRRFLLSTSSDLDDETQEYRSKNQKNQKNQKNLQSRGARSVRTVVHWFVSPVLNGFSQITFVQNNMLGMVVFLILLSGHSEVEKGDPLMRAVAGLIAAVWIVWMSLLYIYVSSTYAKANRRRREKRGVYPRHGKLTIANTAQLRIALDTLPYEEGGTGVSKSYTPADLTHVKISGGTERTSEDSRQHASFLSAVDQSSRESRSLNRKAIVPFHLYFQEVHLHTGAVAYNAVLHGMFIGDLHDASGGSAVSFGRLLWEVVVILVVYLGMAYATYATGNGRTLSPKRIVGGWRRVFIFGPGVVPFMTATFLTYALTRSPDLLEDTLSGPLDASGFASNSTAADLSGSDDTVNTSVIVFRGASHLMSSSSTEHSLMAIVSLGLFAPYSALVIVLGSGVATFITTLWPRDFQQGLQLVAGLHSYNGALAALSVAALVPEHPFHGKLHQRYGSKPDKRSRNDGGNNGNPFWDECKSVTSQTSDLGWVVVSLAMAAFATVIDLLASEWLRLGDEYLSTLLLGSSISIYLFVAMFVEHTNLNHPYYSILSHQHHQHELRAARLQS